MSKADVLLKRAAAFEKLALYSDRRSFLQAIAQTETALTTQFGPDVRAQLESVLKDFPAVGIKDNDTTVYGPVMNALNNFENLDKDSLVTALTIARAFYGPDRAPQLANLDALIKKLGGGYKPPQEDAAGKTLTVPPTTISAPRTINKADQEAVFRFVTEEGIGVPGKIDGILGPDTKNAIKAIQDYFQRANPQNPRMSDAEAIRAAKFQGNR